MNSLDGLQPASPAPFFFTRVKARMEKTEVSVWENLTGFIARPVVAFSVVCLIVLMNTLAFFEQKHSAPSLTEQQTEQSFYDDYNVASNAFYDNENPEP